MPKTFSDFKQPEAEMPEKLKEFLGGFGYKSDKTPAQIAWDKYVNYNGKNSGERLRLMNEALKLKLDKK